MISQRQHLAMSIRSPPVLPALYFKRVYTRTVAGEIIIWSSGFECWLTHLRCKRMDSCNFVGNLHEDWNVNFDDNIDIL